ncbi:MAG: DNA-directed RNA polymerase subunit H [Candidatus Heimdallarchaeaceae archaeon]
MIKHKLVPKHTILTEEEAKKVLQKFNILPMQLPKIHKKDPAISHLEPKKGDIIKIERKSPTNIKSIYYRIVIE